MLKIFISYSKHDKKLAGELKKYFEECEKIECFVAHDDIIPGSSWEQEILKELEIADFFMPLQTDNLENSYWCQQESGFALARKTKIIPLIPNIGGSEPIGFYAKFQGLKIKLDGLRDSVRCWLINEGIISKNSEELEKRMIIFENSGSFYEAGMNIKSLLEMESQFTKADIHRILEKTLNNVQILESWAARDYLKPLFFKHTKLISKEELEKFLNVR